MELNFLNAFDAELIAQMRLEQGLVGDALDHRAFGRRNL